METDGKTCSICGDWKPFCSFEYDRRRPDGHGPRCKWCIRQRRRQGLVNHRPAKELTTPFGNTVRVTGANQLIRFVRSHQGRYAYVTAKIYRATGQLASYCETIRICPDRGATPESIVSTLSAENIHLAMYRMGMGRENVQLDDAKLHSPASRAEMSEEYYGLSIKQFGLLREDR